MKYLRQYIRNIIKESACDNTNDVISKAIKECKRLNIKFDVNTFDDNIIVEMYLETVIGDETYPEMVGHLNASVDDVEDVYVTSSAEIDSQYRDFGIGALLYDIAMENVTQQNNWFTCDGESVSSFAKRMWNFFMNSNNYEQKQLDLIPQPEEHAKAVHFLTITQEDDAYRESFMDQRMQTYSDEYWKEHVAQNTTGAEKEAIGDIVSDNWHFYDPDFKKDYLDSPMTKAYKKISLSTLECLRAEGLLYTKENRP